MKKDKKKEPVGEKDSQDKPRHEDKKSLIKTVDTSPEGDSEEVRKKKIRKHSKRLHPLKFNILDNPFFQYAGKENTLKNLKKLVNLELMLTVITLLLIVLLIVLFLRNPGGFSTPPEQPVAEAPEEEQEDNDEAVVTKDGKVFKDSRDVTSRSLSQNGEESSIPAKLLVNDELGFTAKYFPGWKLEEKKVGGVKNTTVKDENAKFTTYVSFKSTEPDCTKYEGEGTFNVRDVYTFDTLYRAEGYVKFGNALCASFPVKLGKFYIEYAGPLDEVILPVLETVQVF